MRILILSDLHRELWQDDGPLGRQESTADVVVLAGDIDTSGTRAVAWASKYFEGLPVIYVAGNHEAYGRNLDRECEKTLAAAQNTENVFFLDSGEARIGGVRFLGTTLWTDFALFGQERQEESMAAAGAAMTDYRRIRLQSAGYRKLRPSDTLRMHEQQKAWLSEKLNEPFSGLTVVVTHMAPSKTSVPSQYAQDLVSAAYASNLDGLIVGANVWIHGHMHESADYRIGKTRVVCNPFGYANKRGDAENSAFNSNFIIEV